MLKCLTHSCNFLQKLAYMTNNGTMLIFFNVSKIIIFKNLYFLINSHNICFRYFIYIFIFKNFFHLFFHKNSFILISIKYLTKKKISSPEIKELSKMQLQLIFSYAQPDVNCYARYK